MDAKYKDKCQVFTPKENVKQLLDWCGYTTNIFDKKIIENSCGNGQILTEVVERYIKDSINHKKNTREIKKGLEQNIYGIEYDKVKYIECLERLDKIVEKYSINNVNWKKNIICNDALINIEDNKYDFVVGNPPYIKYSILEEKDREYIKNNFESCKHGKFDYCYSFIELSIRNLKKDGIMAYLIPSSIFKNVFAESLREYIKPHIIKIYDFTSTRLFTKETNDKNIDRLTSSAILIAKKNSNSKSLEYYDIVKNKKVVINKENLGKKWIFDTSVNNKTRRFGDYFNVSNTIATLYNKAFVINDYTEDEKYIYVKNRKIEKCIIKDTISPKSIKKNKSEKIIFPYIYQNDDLIRFSEEDFKAKFPYAYEYLSDFNDKLMERKSDSSAKWFEYGRSQALKSSNQEKILISTIITKKVNTKILSENVIPYSGLYITKKSNKSLEFADKILNSKDFFKYISTKGIISSGGSYRITANDIIEYRF